MLKFSNRQSVFFPSILLYLPKVKVIDVTYPLAPPTLNLPNHVSNFDWTDCLAGCEERWGPGGREVEGRRVTLWDPSTVVDIIFFKFFFSS
jgi:hypothetical protein